MSEEALDKARRHEFMMRVLANNAGVMTGFMSGLGERLGLFRALAEHGPASPSELAQRAGIAPRYAAEWCRGMHSAGYLERDPDVERFSMPPEHREVLCGDGSPYSQAAYHQHITSLFPAFDGVLEAFRSGEGIAQEQYSEHFGEAMERTTRTWVERFLVQAWLPMLPELHARLESGATLADFGCDAGAVPIHLAGAFPSSHFTGYDLDPRAIARARAAADAAGVAHRTTFEVRDILQQPTETFDCVTAVDLIHDLPDPRLGLERIRAALRPGGTLLLGEFDAEEDPEDNVNPMATIMYGFSVLFCVPTTLSHGGEALGTMGMPASRVEALCTEAGFERVQRLFTGHPYMALYAVT